MVSALRPAPESTMTPLTPQEALESVGLMAPVAEAQHSATLEGWLAIALERPPVHAVRFPFAAVPIDFSVGYAEVSGALAAVLPAEAHDMVYGRVVRAPIPLVQLGAFEAYCTEKIPRRAMAGAPYETHYRSLQARECRGAEYLGTFLGACALGLSTDGWSHPMERLKALWAPAGMLRVRGASGCGGRGPRRCGRGCRRRCAGGGRAPGCRPGGGGAVRDRSACPRGDPAVRRGREGRGGRLAACAGAASFWARRGARVPADSVAPD